MTADVLTAAIHFALDCLSDAVMSEDGVFHEAAFDDCGAVIKVDD